MMFQVKIILLMFFENLEYILQCYIKVEVFIVVDEVIISSIKNSFLVILGFFDFYKNKLNCKFLVVCLFLYNDCLVELMLRKMLIEFFSSYVICK